MRYAIVKNGVVTNVANAESPIEEGWIASDTAGIGDFYDGQNFSRPIDPPAAAVPVKVTARQAEQALILTNKYDTVVAALEAIPGVQGELARTEWARSQFFERQRPLVLQMAQSLGWSDADLDELFILAGSLS